MTAYPHTAPHNPAPRTGPDTPPRCRNAERLWLRGTWTRLHLRYGRALHELSKVSTPLALGQFAAFPDGQDARDAAEAIETAVLAAYRELDRILAYVGAVLDPGPATCQTCGGGLWATHGQGPAVWQHWRRLSDTMHGFERYTADHPPAVTFGQPDRPDWADGDADLTPPPTNTPANQEEATR
ncbi:hypothetical protein [Actinomadura rupiterrae]|uniref:hypothetical protein n=1 Tax=Actinomadura rupiterrae TaxID=559627 RepID=UPI0020A3C7E1|nr:hypothetical protein [Actinomadura rupiterrae]MCP2336971.1 hypothetical protein [Actinomadura rupiterrae]